MSKRLTYTLMAVFAIPTLLGGFWSAFALASFMFGATAGPTGLFIFYLMAVCAYLGHQVWTWKHWNPESKTGWPKE